MSNPTPEEYKALKQIAQSARILASGQDRERYYEDEWRRLDTAISRWVEAEDNNTVAKLKRLAQMEGAIADQRKQEIYIDELIRILDLGLALYSSALEGGSKAGVPEELYRLITAPIDVRYQVAIAVLEE